MYLAKEEEELLWVPHNSAAWWTLRICALLPYLRSTLGAVTNKLASLGHQPSRSFWPPLWTLLFSLLVFPLRVPEQTQEEPLFSSPPFLFSHIFHAQDHSNFFDFFPWALSNLSSWLSSSADLARPSLLAFVLWSSHRFYCLWPDNLLVPYTASVIFMALLSTLGVSPSCFIFYRAHLDVSVSCPLIKKKNNKDQTFIFLSDL